MHCISAHLWIVLLDLGLFGSGVLGCSSIQAFTGRVPCLDLFEPPSISFAGEDVPNDFNIHVQLNSLVLSGLFMTTQSSKTKKRVFIFSATLHCMPCSLWLQKTC